MIAAALIGATSLAALAVMTARRRLTIAVVRGSSMSPTFADGERVLAARMPRYRVGDVIVFRANGPNRPGDPAARIKRVAAIAGQPVPDRLRDGGALGVSVPSGHLVVVGDNPNSQDSRHIGYVPVTAIDGRVVPRRSSVNVESSARVTCDDKTV